MGSAWCAVQSICQCPHAHPFTKSDQSAGVIQSITARIFISRDLIAAKVSTSLLKYCAVNWAALASPTLFYLLRKFLLPRRIATIYSQFLMPG
jgi:hypothetical protein